jgi:hypothetical protein
MPFCRVAMVAPWDEGPRRRFVAYRCGRGFRTLLGHAVIDEFATLSSPVFLGPAALAGKLYDAGITLAHRRDPEMALDLGWPPLVVGLDEPAPELPGDWQESLLAALAGSGGEAAAGAQRREVGPHRLERLDVGAATLWATDAPLVPSQLGRLCEVAPGPFALAVNVGQAVERMPAGRPMTVSVAGEAQVEALLAAAREMPS